MWGGGESGRRDHRRVGKGPGGKGQGPCWVGRAWTLCGCGCRWEAWCIKDMIACAAVVPLSCNRSWLLQHGCRVRVVQVVHKACQHTAGLWLLKLPSCVQRTGGCGSSHNPAVCELQHTQQLLLLAVVMLPHKRLVNCCSSCMLVAPTWLTPPG